MSNLTMKWRKALTTKKKRQKQDIDSEMECICKAERTINEYFYSVSAWGKPVAGSNLKIKLKRNVYTMKSGNKR